MKISIVLVIVLFTTCHPVSANKTGYQVMDKVASWSLELIWDNYFTPFFKPIASIVYDTVAEAVSVVGEVTSNVLDFTLCDGYGKNAENCSIEWRKWANDASKIASVAA